MENGLKVPLRLEPLKKKDSGASNAPNARKRY
jgi:hypothetical protein